ncbi:MAG: trypsin-like serine protease [Aeromonas sp.]
MKKTLLASALLLALAPAHAVTPGDAISEPAFVAVNGKFGSCSGTVLANHWVVTAEHCLTKAGDSVRTQGNQFASVKQVLVHPFSTGGAVFDMLLLELATPLAQVYSVNPVEPVADTVQQLAGYSSKHGGDLQRTRAKAKGKDAFGDFEESGIYDLHEDMGKTDQGDSGGPCYNEQGVWGVISSDYMCNSIFAAKTKTWLLESINSWSYPAEVKGEGSVSIKVQSLHQGDEVFIPTPLNGLEIESNSCETNSTVPPFGICEVVVKGSGQLSLGGDNLIEVNKPVVVPPQPEENGGNGGGDSGGGAAGWLALLGLGALVVRRRPH